MPKMPREYNFPVWGTQGGGLVREVGGRYFFVEKPNCPGLDVGDEMPSEWGIAAANDWADVAVDDEEQRAFNHGVDEFFNTLDGMVRMGEVTPKQARSFYRRSS